MILLIDNFDSFSYNLFQLIGAIEPDIRVIRNDEMTPQEIETLNPSHIFISPGPGRPGEAGVCEDVIAYFKDKVPIFGVCLGHQAICETFGGTVGHASHLMHGKQSVITVDTKCPLFTGLPEQIPVARYHSLSAKEDSLGDCLTVTARSDDGEVMAVQHRDYPVFGVQFHPESILTKYGKEMIENFLKYSK